MKGKCLHQLFMKQVEATPNEIAVVDGKKVVTYEQLNNLSDSLAGYLQRQRVGIGDAVGILMDKSLEYVVAHIAILKAGGAYIPLELSNPDTLIHKMLQATCPKVVVTKNSYTERVKECAQLLPVDQGSWSDFAYREPLSITEEDLAYIVFSSGTTGEPKGILAPHRGAVYSYHCRYEISSYRPKDRVACNVFFVWELLRPLLKGATCYVIPDEIIYDPRPLVQFLASNQINEVLFTPSLLENVLNSVASLTLRDKLSPLKVMWLNGEVVTNRLKKRALQALPQHTRLLNTYSISECHDVASVDLRTIEDTSEICPVGAPIPDVKIKLLDINRQKVENGQVGELYIGGPCLAHGYLNNAELTTKRFNIINGDRYYRTGDLAVVLDNGYLEIKGRCDSMVKIRGYSINLGAIETNLLLHAPAASSLVIAEGKEGEEKRLVAYVVKNENSHWKIDPQTGICTDIRKKLAPYLPQYMIPSVYVEVEHIPINAATGKGNKQLLPAAPRCHNRNFEEIRVPENASQETQQQAMRAIWERLLMLEQGTVGPKSSFFDCGGHSLLAAELSIALEKIFGKHILVKDVYEHPTLEDLVAFINRGYKVFSSSFKEDAQLSPDIITAPPSEPLSLNQAKAIWLTGSTGFLGGNLLAKILQSTGEDVKIYCLVRARQGGHTAAFQSIVNNLQRYQLWRPAQASRVVPVIGDLGQPNLGLSPQEFAEYAQKIDCIFHSGALVNYVYSYQVLKPAVVNGTSEILRLAATSRVKPVHYISTNGIFSGLDNEPYLENRDIYGYADYLSGGYCPAKWVAEALVWQAIDRGIPAFIYRPGNIGHSSETGIANPNDFQYMIIDACTKVQCVPEVPSWAFEMTPVDFLAAAIVCFASSPAHYSKVYNIVEANPIPAQEVFQLMQKMGLTGKSCSLTLWKEALYSKALVDGYHMLHVLAQSLDDVRPYLEDKNIYDCRQFHQDIAGYGLKLPKTNIEYFRKMFYRSCFQKQKIDNNHTIEKSLAKK